MLFCVKNVHTQHYKNGAQDSSDIGIKALKFFENLNNESSNVKLMRH